MLERRILVWCADAAGIVFRRRVGDRGHTTSGSEAYDLKFERAKAWDCLADQRATEIARIPVIFTAWVSCPPQRKRDLPFHLIDRPGTMTVWTLSVLSRTGPLFPAAVTLPDIDLAKNGRRSTHLSNHRTSIIEAPLRSYRSPMVSCI